MTRLINSVTCTPAFSAVTNIANTASQKTSDKHRDTVRMELGNLRIASFLVGLCFAYVRRNYVSRHSSRERQGKVTVENFLRKGFLL